MFFPKQLPNATSHGSYRMRILARLLCAGLLFTIFISPTFAQNENPPDLVTGPSYGGLDLVFLVDQSGSMRINDPYEQRINTIKWVVESLGIDNLYFRPDAANRIGIVSFGTDARIDLPLVPLKVTESGQPATADLERVLRDRIKNDIEPKIMADSMGNTDVLRGLELVKQVFDEAPPAQQAVASAPRNRGIIILTDGPPYVEGWREDPRYANSNFYTPYFRELETYIRNNLAIATRPRSPDGYHIWVLGLNATADQGNNASPGTSWLEQEARWEKVLNPASGVDRVVRMSSKSNADIPAVVVRVLDTIMAGGVCANDEELQGRPSCLIDEKFTVPPYLDRAVFSIFKPQPNSQIEFYLPNGQKLDRSAASVSTSQTGTIIERLVVDRPTPGNWRWQKLDASPETATVKFDPLFNQPVLREPSSHQELFDTTGVQIDLLDRNGNKTSLLADYPIDATATLVSPDGRETNLSMRAESDGTLRSTNTFLLDQPGEYVVRFSAKTRDSEGQEVPIFLNRRLPFIVGALVPKLVKPEGAVMPFREVPLEFELGKPDGSPLGANSQGRIRWELTVTSPEGTATAIPIITGSGQNRYVTDSPIAVVADGKYLLNVRGFLNITGKQVVKVFEEALSFTADCLHSELVSPRGDVPENGRIQIQVDVRACAGQPFVEDAKYPWVIQAILGRPDGSTSNPMIIHRVSDGLYEGEFIPDIVGSWNLTVSSLVQLPNGSQVEAFPKLTRAIDVYDTSRIQMQVLSPSAGAREAIRTFPKIPLIPESSIGKPTSTDVRLQIVNLENNNELIQLSDLSNQPGQLVTVEVQSPDQITARRPVTLSVVAGDPYRLETTLSDLNTPGTYTLTLAFTDQLKREFILDSSGSNEIVIQRYDATIVFTYIIAAMELLLTLFLAITLIRAIIIRINPVHGTLEFEKVGSTGRSSYGTLALSGYGKNTFVIKGSKLRTLLAPEAADSLSKLKIKNATERTKTTDQFDTGAGLDGSAIRIWAWSGDNDPIISDEVLANNQSTILHGDIQIRYHRDLGIQQ